VVVLKKAASSSAFLDKAIAFPWSAPTLAFARPVCHAVSEKLGSLFRLMLLVAGFSRESNSLDLQDFLLAASTYPNISFWGELNHDDVILGDNNNKSLLDQLSCV
jgi:hypothetical protein